MNKTGLVISAFAGLSLVSTAARADEVVVTGHRMERQGVVIGASIDGGNIGCQTKNGDDCGDGAHPAGGFSVHVGGSTKETLASFF